MELVFKSATSDWDDVLKAAASGDADAPFAALVTRQSRFVFRIAYAVLRNADDAEDVVQETFLKLFRSGAWAAVQDERAFLARAAWRMAVSRKRPPTPNPVENCENATQETAAMDDQRNRRIHALIDSLPDKLRAPLTLSAFEDLTTAEIAAILGQPEGTIRRRISEARDLLRQKLGRMDRHAR